ncbi:hypothetical protein D3C76_709140 [compost metagenome]
MAGEVRMHDQRLQHGRHQEDVGDAFALNGLHEFERVERGHEHVGLANDQLDHQARQAGGVEHRGDVQHRRVLRHVERAQA